MKLLAENISIKEFIKTYNPNGYYLIFFEGEDGDEGSRCFNIIHINESKIERIYQCGYSFNLINNTRIFTVNYVYR